MGRGGGAAATGVVTTEELRVYVASAVAKRTDSLQHPTVDRDNLDSRFGLSRAR